jgi:hypothetical protein
MTLATHAVTGAVIASAMPHHAVLGFILGFASHFLLDAIPHWDYPLSSYKADPGNRLNDDMPINRAFWIDLSRIGTDLLCGGLLTLVFFTFTGPHLFWIPALGAAGAVLPDALQFVYWKWRHQPLIALQRFHLWIHAKKNFNGRPLIGVPLQAIFILLMLLISRSGM